jgi:ATP-dependent DNA helicase RecG
LKRQKIENLKTSGKIIDLIKENSYISIHEMAAIIGVTERSAECNIQRLQLNSRIKRVGGAKGEHWEITH